MMFNFGKKCIIIINFKNFKKLFTSFMSRKKINCVEFKDYPVFDIDGKRYYVDLKKSRLMMRAKNYLKTINKRNEKGFIIVTDIKRTYPIPSLNKYLRLKILIACELVDDEYYAITHLEVEKAFLLDTAYGVIEPEIVQELK